MDLKKYNFYQLKELMKTEVLHTNAQFYALVWIKLPEDISIKDIDFEFYDFNNTLRSNYFDLFAYAAEYFSSDDFITSLYNHKGELELKKTIVPLSNEQIKYAYKEYIKDQTKSIKGSIKTTNLDIEIANKALAKLANKPKILAKKKKKKKKVSTTINLQTSANVLSTKEVIESQQMLSNNIEFTPPKKVVSTIYLLPKKTTSENMYQEETTTQQTTENKEDNQKTNNSECMID